MSNGKFKKKINQFTQISNAVLTDTNLSFKAIGLYCKINHYITIPDFDLYKAFLIKNSKEGQKAFDNAWKELKEEGYLLQTRCKDPKTGIFYWEYELLDEPIIDQNPYIPKGGYGESMHGEVGVYNNTDLNKTKNNNIKDSSSSTTQQNEHIADVSKKIDDEILNLKSKIDEKLNANISKPHLKKLINKHSVANINKYIDNWDKFVELEENKINNSIGYLTVLLENNSNIPKTINKALKTNSSKPEQCENFKQRKYADDEYDMYYQ